MSVAMILSLRNRWNVSLKPLRIFTNAFSSRDLQVSKVGISALCAVEARKASLSPGHLLANSQDKVNQGWEAADSLPCGQKASNALKKVDLDKYSGPSASSPTQESNNVFPNQDMPLSPLMYVYRKERKQPKVLRQEKTSFEEELSANPFAAMLASPIRACSITEARVPSAFLRPFTLRKDPITNVHWQLPRDLDPSPLGGDNTQRISSTLRELDSEGPVARDLPWTTKKLPTCWVSSVSDGMNYMCEGFRSKRSKRESIRRMRSRTLTPRWKRVLAKGDLGNIQVKSNHQDLILDLLKRRCARELSALAQESPIWVNDCLVPLRLGTDDLTTATNNLEQILNDHSVANRKETVASVFPAATLLWLGDATKNNKTCAQMKPLLFGTQDTPISNPIWSTSAGTSIPVVDVEKLLGEECMGWLRNKSTIYRNPALVVKYSLQSRNVITYLWHLRLY